MPDAPRAIVFAYHDVGVRCLRTLLAHGVHVPLVITHEDNPAEQIWFDSVARHAAWHGIPCITPADVHAPGVMAQLRAARPDFLFSFYYRSMLREDVLGLAPRGAYNMHGSLLPKYRGRVPVNWAVLKGETHTGATLHRMAVKPDAGDIVAQQAVPILPDDTAGEVFRKVCVAAEIALDGVLPALLAGKAVHTAQDLSAGSYHGGRTARDGVIDWRLGVQAVHNLVRAVAPPYPGAFGQAAGLPLRVLRTRVVERATQANTPTGAAGGASAGAEFVPELFSKDGAVFARAHDGVLQLLEFELGAEAAGVAIRDAAAFRKKFGATPVALRAFME